MIPVPADVEAPVAVLVEELAGHVGVPALVDLACELLGGGDPSPYSRELVYLTGHAGDHDGWAEYWPRVWGARALLYAWEDRAEPDVVRGLADPAWRVAEMCLKVATKRELGTAGPGAAALVDHELSRVRGQAVRLLGIAGDTEHVAAVQAAEDDPDGAVRRHAARALDRMAIRLDLADP